MICPARLEVRAHAAGPIGPRHHRTRGIPQPERERGGQQRASGRGRRDVPGVEQRPTSIEVIDDLIAPPQQPSCAQRVVGEGGDELLVGGGRLAGRTRERPCDPVDLGLGRRVGIGCQLAQRELEIPKRQVGRDRLGPRGSGSRIEIDAVGRHQELADGLRGARVTDGRRRACEGNEEQGRGEHGAGNGGRAGVISLERRFS
jgi:hypothetical protein